jgi:hypothetical protein
MPENTVSVARPGIWGNPFSVMPHLKIGQRIGPRYYAVPTAEDAVACFREMLTIHDGETADALRERLPQLRGKNLACWCPLGQPCHADVLLELANPTPAPDASPSASSAPAAVAVPSTSALATDGADRGDAG